MRMAISLTFWRATVGRGLATVKAVSGHGTRPGGQSMGGQQIRPMLDGLASSSCVCARALANSDFFDSPSLKAIKSSMHPFTLVGPACAGQLLA